jgi:uncharacterized protein (TIGR03546 family)
MILWFLQQVLVLRKFSETALTPHHAALACTLGMVLGLLPKGNLLAVGVTVVVLSLRVNLAIVMCSTLCFTLISGLFDPVTHPIGTALLTHDSLQSLWTRLFELPLMRWMALNNSVVLGSLLFAFAVSLPGYLVTRSLLSELFRRFPVFQRAVDRQASSDDNVHTGSLPKAA